MMQVVIDAISHGYSQLNVLQDVSFKVASGDTAAIIGPSGCGKSTLIGIVGGLIKPSSGRVTVIGNIQKSLNPFTFVFQDFALLPWRTVEGNIRLVLEDHPLTPAEIQERVDDCLSRTGLLAFKQALPRQLSGGMRQRVGIARALAVDPPVLLMDEPLSALDAQTRELLMDDFLKIYAEQQTATLHVTHNLDACARSSSRSCCPARCPRSLPASASLRRWFRMSVVGAPSYFARRPKPKKPQDLTAHDCINIRLPTYGGIYAWEFEKRGRELKVRVDGQLVFNSLAMRINAALAGMGLAYLPEDQVKPCVDSGQLIRVLDDWCAPFSGYHLYYPSRRHSSPAFGLLIDAIRYRE